MFQPIPIPNPLLMYIFTAFKPHHYHTYFHPHGTKEGMKEEGPLNSFPLTFPFRLHFLSTSHKLLVSITFNSSRRPPNSPFPDNFIGHPTKVHPESDFPSV